MGWLVWLQVGVAGNEFNSMEKKSEGRADWVLIIFESWPEICTEIERL